VTAPAATRPGHRWRETHMDLRLPDGEFLLEVPIDYVRTLD
jgi:hypothetical protein